MTKLKYARKLHYFHAATLVSDMKDHIMSHLILSPGVQVGFDPILYNVSESDGVVALVVRRFTPSSIPVTVLFSTQNGTAIGMLILCGNANSLPLSCSNRA